MKPGTAKILKWSILGVLLCYLALISVWANRVSVEHVCTGIKVEVEGQPAMDSVVKAGVLEELSRYPERIVGSQIHSISTLDIEKYLSSRNNFESVHCMINSHGELLVQVTPMIPVMRVFYGDYSYYVNREGKVIETNAEFFTDVPVVTGRFSRTFQPQDIMPVVRYVNGDAKLRSLVSMINAESPNDILLIPRITGHVINFGDTTRLDDKRHSLLLFYREVIPYKGWEEYDTISVKYRGQVVATRRDKTKLNHSEQYEEEEDLEEGTLPDGGNNAATTANNGTETANAADAPQQGNSTND